MHRAIAVGIALLDIQWSLAVRTKGVRRRVEVTREWTLAGLVDCVDGHGHRAALGHLSDLVRSQGILGVLSNIDVASNHGTATLIDDVGDHLGGGDEVGVGRVIGVDYG